jgi:hypothetical protein
VHMQLRMALEELRQEGLAAAEKLAQHEEASHVQLQALQSAISAAQVINPLMTCSWSPPLPSLTACTAVSAC